MNFTLLRNTFRLNLGKTLIVEIVLSVVNVLKKCSFIIDNINVNFVLFWKSVLFGLLENNSKENT